MGYLIWAILSNLEDHGQLVLLIQRNLVRLMLAFAIEIAFLGKSLTLMNPLGSPFILNESNHCVVEKCLKGFIFGIVHYNSEKGWTCTISHRKDVSGIRKYLSMIFL